jgi:hypothetical protein
VTPHTGGGRSDQDDALVDLFLGNLSKFTVGDLTGMGDRVV